MRTLQRARARASNPGLHRVGGLLMLGILIAVLYSLSSKPANWKWLTHEGPSEEAAEVEGDQASPVKVAKKDSGTDKAALPSAEPVIESPPSGPTDEDPEQFTEAKEEFQAVLDGTLKMRKEEMFAYWRLIGWSKSQTTEQMLRRATKVSLHDMMTKADEQRGKLVKVKLNVRIVVESEATENDADVKKIYEIWGWADDTKSWLYLGVTHELPEGMPIGKNVYERVTLVGYFLKLQGYLAAESKPGDRPLASPLLIGRVAWHPAKPAQEAKEPWWMWWALGGVGAIAVAVCIVPWFLRPKPSRTFPPLTDPSRIIELGAEPMEAIEEDDYSASYQHPHDDYDDRLK